MLFPSVLLKPKLSLSWMKPCVNYIPVSLTISFPELSSSNKRCDAFHPSLSLWLHLFSYFPSLRTQLIIHGLKTDCRILSAEEAVTLPNPHSEAMTLSCSLRQLTEKTHCGRTLHNTPLLCWCNADDIHESQGLEPVIHKYIRALPQRKADVSETRTSTPFWHTSVRPLVFHDVWDAERTSSTAQQSQLSQELVNVQPKILTQ